MSQLLIATLSVTPPTFPIDFYAGVQNNIILAQGESVRHENFMCCAASATACKVQTISAGMDTYQQGSMNRTLTLGGSTGTQMKWYGAGVDKEMALMPGSAANSTHKWACGLYCPLRGADFASLVAIAPEGERVRDDGIHKITQAGLPGGLTKTAHGYGWTQRLLKVRAGPMERALIRRSSTTLAHMRTEPVLPPSRVPCSRVPRSRADHPHVRVCHVGGRVGRRTAALLLDAGSPPLWQAAADRLCQPIVRRFHRQGCL